MLIKNSALSFACTAKSTLNTAPLTLSTPKHLAEISRFFLILKIFFSPLLTSFYTHTNRLFHFTKNYKQCAKNACCFLLAYLLIIGLFLLQNRYKCSPNYSLAIIRIPHYEHSYDHKFDQLFNPPFFCSFNYIFFLGIKKPRQEFFQPWLKRLFV